MSGYFVSSDSDICLPESSWNAVPHTGTSRISHISLDVMRSLSLVGVVTTARSTSPCFSAETACGVEWLNTLIRTPGYFCLKSFRTGSRKQRSAISLAPMEKKEFLLKVM